LGGRGWLRMPVAHLRHRAAVVRGLPLLLRPSKRLLIESRWVSKPLALAGQPRPRRLNNSPLWLTWRARATTPSTSKPTTARTAPPSLAAAR
jgi:hypothetical protein